MPKPGPPSPRTIQQREAERPAKIASEAKALLDATEKGACPPAPGNNGGLREMSGHCLYRPPESWSAIVAANRVDPETRQELSRHLFTHDETFGADYVIEIFSWGVSMNHHGGVGGGSTKSRLLLKSEVPTLKSVTSLGNGGEVRDSW